MNLTTPSVEFNKASDGAAFAGNCFGGAQTSLHIRPFNETECNGLHREPGELQQFDLNVFRRTGGLCPSIEHQIQIGGRNERYVLYKLHGGRDEAYFGWLLTDGKGREIARTRGRARKSAAVLVAFARAVLHEERETAQMVSAARERGFAFTDRRGEVSYQRIDRALTIVLDMASRAGVMYRESIQSLSEFIERHQDFLLREITHTSIPVGEHPTLQLPAGENLAKRLRGETLPVIGRTPLQSSLLAALGSAQAIAVGEETASVEYAEAVIVRNWSKFEANPLFFCQ